MKLPRLPRFVKNSAIYSIITILQKGISFFLLPLYTAFLSPADYGVMNIVTTVTSLLSLLFLLGLSSAATRFYYQHKDDEQYIRELWGTLLTFVVINSVVLGSIFLLLHKYLIDPIIGNVPFYPYFILGIATTIVSPLYLFFQSYLQTRQQGGRYGINLLSNFLIQTFLIIMFVAGFKMGVLGVLLAQLITAVLFFIYVLIAFLPKVKMGINIAILRPAFKYSLPLVPHLLAGWSTGLLDRLLINGMKNESETGLYSVANQFSSITSSLTNAVNMAYVPWFMERYEEKRFHDITKAGNAAVLLYSCVAFLISMFCPEVLKIMVTEQFQRVWNIIPLLSFSCVLNGVYFLFVNTLFLQKTKYVFVITITALLFNLGLNLLLIPQFSYVGSAMACFIAYFVKSIVAMILSRIEVKEIDFGPLRLYGIVFLFFGLTFINFVTQDFSVFIAIIIKLVVIGTLFALFWFNYKNAILEVVQTIRNRK